MREPAAVAVSQRVVPAPGRGETRDGLDQAWATWLGGLGLDAVPVPNRLRSVEAFLDRVRPVGVVLSGGNNLAMPVYDGLDASGDDAFAERDATELAMVEWAIARGVPVLGVCRGMQFLQAHFGGRLAPLDGAVAHVATRHGVSLSACPYGPVGTGTATVNSFHRFGIPAGTLAAPLRAFATADDGSIEAFRHADRPVVGIMWHPERADPAADLSRAIAASLLLAPERPDRR